MGGRLAWQLLWSGALLYSLPVLAQMPPKSGILTIKSEPPGADITINGSPISNKTDVTLVVSPTAYTVSVGTKLQTPYCADRSFQVDSGKTVVVVCKASGWVTQQ